MNDSFRFGDVSGPVNAGAGQMNVGSGNQYVAGGDLTVGNTVAADPAAAAAIERLRSEVAALRLTAAERAEAEQQIDGLAGASDKGVAAKHLGAFVSGLKRAGAITSAGAGFVDSVTKLAHLIGPVASGVLTLL